MRSAPRRGGPAADRHRQLQGHQRPARTRHRRPGDPPRRRRHVRGDRRGRAAGSAGRRRVRGGPAGRGRRRRHDAGQAALRGGGHDADGRHRRAADHGQHRCRGRAGRRRRSRPGAGRSRPLRGQERGPQPGPAVRQRPVRPDGAPGVIAPAGPDRAGPGHDAAGRAADRRSDDRPHVALRGADPAPRRKLPAARSGRLPAGRRADRPGAAPGSLGAGTSHSGARHAGCAGAWVAAGGQRVGALAGGRRPGPLDPGRPGAGRRRAEPPGTGDHRDDGDRQPGGGPIAGHPADGGRLRVRPGRLRGRLRFVLLPETPAVHLGQDRRGVRPPAGPGPGGPGAGRRCGRGGQAARHAHGGRAGRPGTPGRLSCGRPGSTTGRATTSAVRAHWTRELRADVPPLRG